ncbi:hypothetical protein D9M69_571520 [compost metagenome]
MVDHAAVGVHAATVQVEQVLRHLGRHVCVVARFPGPVWCGVVQAQEKGRAAARLGRARLHVFHRLVREHVRQVAHFLVRLVIDVEVVVAAGRAVGEVVHPAGHDAEKFFVARAQRAEVRRVAQVPFADQRRAVAGLLQQRGQGGDLGRQAQGRAAFAAAVDRLFERAAQAVLVAHGGHGKTRG